jgi:hypothetical protein
VERRDLIREMREEGGVVGWGKGRRIDEGAIEGGWEASRVDNDVRRAFVRVRECFRDGDFFAFLVGVYCLVLIFIREIGQNF